jgi:hypothetical protein
MVVGVGNYEQWPDLPNAANDAKHLIMLFDSCFSGSLFSFLTTIFCTY